MSTADALLGLRTPKSDLSIVQSDLVGAESRRGDRSLFGRAIGGWRVGRDKAIGREVAGGLRLFRHVGRA